MQPGELNLVSTVLQGVVVLSNTGLIVAVSLLVSSVRDLKQRVIRIEDREWTIAQAAPLHMPHKRTN